MNNLRKLLSVLLILCLFATLAPAAFAEDSTETVWAEPGKEKEYGNVTVNNEDEVYGAAAYADSTGDASLTVTGNVSATSTSEDAVAVMVGAQEGGTAAIKVDGNVAATGEEAQAVMTYAWGEKSTATVTVGGNVTATGTEYATGAEATAADGGSANLTVSGDVTASGGEFAIGVQEYVSDGGKATAKVEGGVTASGTESVAGVSIYANDGTATVTVEGNVKATGSGEIAGAAVMAGDNASTTLEVFGDVTSDGYGIALAGGADEDATLGTIDVYVEGTVKGEESSIAVMSAGGVEDAVTLTIWKAELNEDGNVVGTYIPEYAHYTDEAKEEVEKAAAEIEKNILYIIKYETPDGATLNLQGTVKSHGKDAAKEGDTVTLNTLVKEGYKLVGIDSTVTLMQDTSGNYYIVVPKGGGVFLKVKLDKVAAAANEVYTGPAILGTRQFKDGTFLYLFADNTFTIIFPDGKTEKGTWEFEDGAIVFTNKSGDTFEPTKNDDGNYEYTYVRKDGKEFKFTLSKTFTGRTIKAAEKV